MTVPRPDQGADYERKKKRRDGLREMIAGEDAWLTGRTQHEIEAELNDGEEVAEPCRCGDPECPLGPGPLTCWTGCDAQ